MQRLLVAVLFVTCLVAGCGRESKGPRIFAAGDKATAGALIYNVVDVHIMPRLGDDPGNARLPQNRFFLVKVSASNSSSSEVSIPSLALIDDNGKVYNEIADGTNVPEWLGVLRRVDPGMTDTGVVVFDAPSQHYRIRLTEETDQEDISIDIPLTFVNESTGPAFSPPEPQAGPAPK